MKIGKLMEVNIRDVWKHEQYNFSKWLASDENITELGDVLGLSLTDIETEKNFGSYRCDIICRDEYSEKVVLIENQLEQTNHDHLGKLITYASGLNAAIVVWIVTEARSEHASAVQWLNQHTDDSVAFFLLEIHAYKIGDSLPAPRFTIIEKPNDFVRNVKRISQGGVSGTREAYNIEFWSQFVDILERRGKPIIIRTPPAESTYRVPLGSSHYRIDIELSSKAHCVKICLWIMDSKDMYDEAFAHKEEIENALGFPLIWYRLDDKKMSAITYHIPGLDFQKQENYPEIMNEVIDKMDKMRKTIVPYFEHVK